MTSLSTPEATLWDLAEGRTDWQAEKSLQSRWEQVQSLEGGAAMTQHPGSHWEYPVFNEIGRSSWWISVEGGRERVIR